MNIGENFKVVGNNIDNLFTPQNLFFFDIFSNKNSVKSLITECSAIEWINWEEYLIQSFKAAMHVWVDEKNNYFELINYRETLINTVKLSFYIHIKLQSSITIAYESGIDKKKYERCDSFIDTSWNSMNILFNDFIQFFHFQKDPNLINLNKLFETRKCNYSFANEAHRIAEHQFIHGSNLYNSNKIMTQNIVNLVEKNKLKLNDLINWSKENVSNLMGYLKKVNDLFENVDFEIYEVFYKIFSNKS
ncbi:uncharacterized protein LOC126897549 [Daktulosphaira vitifoliae]|uniref:uncharacterized protein LOC126897549 n=1 Tax=Daktulosphaira vitifoliae TaxID=58002 RepID=UPI0021A9C7ED|nr:uncharacterized protein LOC126897549 [Daktulosphaira vitifoliae]